MNNHIAMTTPLRATPPEQRRALANDLEPAQPDWRKYLPADWQDAIDEPLYFAHYSEYEISAERSLGYDADDRPCFTCHRYQLTRPHPDDDEAFYETISYSEEMAAWRLRDERWLIFRMVSNGQGTLPRGFYVISPEMPR